MELEKSDEVSKSDAEVKDSNEIEKVKDRQDLTLFLSTNLLQHVSQRFRT